jgi:hypothetical protein
LGHAALIPRATVAAQPGYRERAKIVDFADADIAPKLGDICCN